MIILCFTSVLTAHCAEHCPKEEHILPLQDCPAGTKEKGELNRETRETVS